MKQKKNILDDWDWLPEPDAIRLLGGVPKRTLRENAKHRVWDIHFTHINGKKFQYSISDIKKFLDGNSNRLKTAS